MGPPTKAAPKRLHPVDVWEAEQIARAAYFTTCRFLGVGRYSRERHPTLAAAEQVAAATGDGRTMIYAVTPEGWSIFIKGM